MKIAFERHPSIKVGEVVDPPLRRQGQRAEQGDQKNQQTKSSHLFHGSFLIHGFNWSPGTAALVTRKTVPSMRQVPS